MYRVGQANEVQVTTMYGLKYHVGSEQVSFYRLIFNQLPGFEYSRPSLVRQNLNKVLSNIWTLLEPSLIRHADHTAWICRQRDDKRIVSYRQIYDSALGIGAEDTVGITAPNGPEWTIAALACFRTGAKVAPIHIGNSDHDIARQIEAVGLSLMMRHASKLPFDKELPITMQSDQTKIEAEKQQAPASDPQAVALRIYTSGSTGKPKIVKLSHANLASNTLAATKIETFGPQDRVISLLPFSHAMGLTGNVNLPYYCGATLVSPKVLVANEILATLEEEGISVIIAVPQLFRNVMHGLEKKFAEGGTGLALYRKLLKALPVRWRGLLNGPIRRKFGGKIKIWVSGGSHLDGEISRYYHELGLPLRQGYGMTETSPLACIQENFDQAVESVGRPVDQVEVKICSPTKKAAARFGSRGPT